MRIIRRLNEIYQTEGAEFVTALYREFLDRDPDPTGLHHYVNQLYSGKPKDKILQSIFLSSEAQNLLQSQVNVIAEEHIRWGQGEPNNDRLVPISSEFLARAVRLEVFRNN